MFTSGWKTFHHSRVFVFCFFLAAKWPAVDSAALPLVSMLACRLLTWASLLLRGFPEDLRLLGAQRPQASQFLRQLRVGQREVHPVGRRGRGWRAVKHFIAAWAQSAFLFLVTGFLSMEMNQSTMPTLKTSVAPLHRERAAHSRLANSVGFTWLFFFHIFIWIYGSSIFKVFQMIRGSCVTSLWVVRQRTRLPEA